MRRYRKDSLPELAGQQDEGQVLWEKVAQTVKRRNLQQSLQPEKQQRKAKRVSKVNPQTDYSQPIQSVPEKAKTLSSETKPADFRIGEITGIDRSSARRLQRGQMQIEDRLDLHGLSRENRRVNSLSVSSAGPFNEIFAMF